MIAFGAIMVAAMRIHMLFYLQYLSRAFVPVRTNLFTTAGEDTLKVVSSELV